MSEEYKIIDLSKVGIVLATSYSKWYPGPVHKISDTDKVRGDLALSFIRKAVRAGVKVSMSDWKSAPRFLMEATHSDMLHLIKRKTEKRSAAVREGIKYFAEFDTIEAILLTEPEKVSLLDSLDILIKPIMHEGAHIVVPMRESSRFEHSYPQYQYESEIEGNIIYNRILKEQGIIKEDHPDFDFFFGPRVIANVIPVRELFLKKYHLESVDLDVNKSYFDTDEYSNSNYFPVVTALHKKMKVVSIEIPFVYPPTQKANEQSLGAKEKFIEKRNTQRLGLTVELMHFVSYLKKRVRMK